MTRSEWNKTVAILAANWPHQIPPDQALDKWFFDLEDQHVEHVLAAIESFNRDGKEFPPNGGQILARIRQLANPEVDHGEAWRLLNQATAKFGGRRGDEALEWIEAQSPAAAEAVRCLGFRDYCMSNVEDQATWRAQYRDIFRNVSERKRREDLHPQIEGGFQKPKPIGAGVLKQIGGPR